MHHEIQMTTPKTHKVHQQPSQRSNMKNRICCNESGYCCFCCTFCPKDEKKNHIGKCSAVSLEVFILCSLKRRFVLWRRLFHIVGWLSLRRISQSLNTSPLLRVCCSSHQGRRLNNHQHPGGQSQVWAWGAREFVRFTWFCYFAASAQCKCFLQQLAIDIAVFGNLAGEIHKVLICFHFQPAKASVAAQTFSKNSQERHLSLSDRKRNLIESARQRYREKHGMLWWGSLNLSGLVTLCDAAQVVSWCHFPADSLHIKRNRSSTSSRSLGATTQLPTNPYTCPVDFPSSITVRCPTCGQSSVQIDSKQTVGRHVFWRKVDLARHEFPGKNAKDFNLRSEHTIVFRKANKFYWIQTFGRFCFLRTVWHSWPNLKQMTPTSGNESFMSFLTCCALLTWTDSVQRQSLRQCNVSLRIRSAFHLVRADRGLPDVSAMKNLRNQHWTVRRDTDSWPNPARLFPTLSSRISSCKQECYA